MWYLTGSFVNKLARHNTRLFLCVRLIKSCVWLCFISKSVFSIRLYFVCPSELLSSHQLPFCGVFVLELSIHIHTQTLVFYLRRPRMHCASVLFKSEMNVLRGKHSKDTDIGLLFWLILWQFNLQCYTDTICILWMTQIWWLSNFSRGI